MVDILYSEELKCHSVSANWMGKQLVSSTEGDQMQQGMQVRVGGRKLKKTGFPGNFTSLK